MKIVVAPDKYKGSADAPAVARAIGRGLRKFLPEAEVDICPVADGGEGTVGALVEAAGGRLVEVTVTGPLGEPVGARFGLLPGGRAVVEMAAASGLHLVSPERRRPLDATTHGTGELVRAALDAGATDVIVGLGGSATTDGGVGLAAALGARFTDENGAGVGPGGGQLERIADIDLSGLDGRLAKTRFVAATDVANPLVGEHGTALTYALQKGATEREVELLERGLVHLAELVASKLGLDVGTLPGAGAAGGLGAGLVAFLGAEITNGAELVIEAVDLERRLDGAHLVITGEGRVDSQTVFGKAPIAVAGVAKRRGLPVVLIAGTVGPGAEAVYEAGVDALVPIVDGPVTPEDALANAVPLIERAAERVARLLVVGRAVYRA